ncbi:hypothetical protein QBC47DRAFT_306295 [Echria macrotheca]|uniref:Uncharacterized protein n=1 Tax=Echria macrotheca TaxID=438768 RepID=A0AAJ0F8N9_9PEZI|nr:hypothetical protein QBC47DRAFT_306295 [Echria macrotheca]
MLFADIFVVGIVSFVWALISICVAVYLTDLARYEIPRRWPQFSQETRRTWVMLSAIFVLAVILWPAIFLWELAARHYAAGGQGCCVGCRPCISDEAYEDKGQSRRAAMVRLRDSSIAIEPPTPFQGMEASSAGESAERKDKDMTPAWPGKVALPTS